MICPAEPLLPFPPPDEKGGDKAANALPPAANGPPTTTPTPPPRGLRPPPATPSEVIGIAGLAAALSGAALGTALGVETASFNEIAHDPRSLLFVTAAFAFAGAAALSLLAAPLALLLALLAAAGRFRASAATLRAGALAAATFAILVQVVLFADPADGAASPLEFGALDALCVGLFVLFAALLMAALFLYGRAHFSRRGAASAAAVAFPSRFAALGSALTLFLLLAVSAVSSPPPSLGPPPPAPAAGDPRALAFPAPRLVVVGIDGLSPEHLDDAIRAGAVPTLERYRREGFLTGCAPPPRASRTASWVTVLTGERPESHGVRADSYCVVAGLVRPLPLPPLLPEGLPSRPIVDALFRSGLARSAPAPAALRAAPTAIETLRSRGVSAVEVAFPAADARRAPDPPGSAIVADEAIAALRNFRRRRDGAPAAPLAAADARGARYAPLSVADLVLEAADRGEAQAELEFRAFASLSGGSAFDSNDPLDVLLALSRADGASAAIGESLARSLAPRVLAARLPAFGEVVRSLEAAGVPVRLGSSESAAALAALRAADRLVARLAAAAGDGANVIVVSDRGDAGEPLAPNAPETRARLGGASAVFLAFGPDVRPGGGPGVSAETLDVAPTLLYLAGARPSAGTRGRILGEAIDERLLRERPIVPLPVLEGRP